MSLRVLVADRDTALLEMYRAYLSWDGFSIITASTGLGCMVKLRAHAPDVLVLELDLLWGGGSGVLASMRDDPELANIPVIVLSNEPEDYSPCADVVPPVQEYLVKPQSPPALANAIRQLVAMSAVGAAADSSLWLG
jgi:two-component system cell cycle response regulator